MGIPLWYGMVDLFGVPIFATRAWVSVGSARFPLLLIRGRRDSKFLKIMFYAYLARLILVTINFLSVKKRPYL
jgi:hypothetical protein